MHPEQLPDPNQDLPPEPTVIGGNAVQSDNEFLQQGLTQLSESLPAVAEQDPDDVAFYLHDILADTEGASDPAERAAVLDVLAKAQRQHLVEQLAETHTSTVAELRAGESSIVDTKGKPVAYDAFTAARGQLEPVSRALSTMAGGNIPSMPLRQINEVGVVATQRISRGLSELHNGFDTWGRNQARHMNELAAKAQSTGQHARALQSAEQSLQPGEQDSPRDLSKLIDKAVYMTFAERYAEQLEQARSQGKPDAEALQATLQTFSGEALEGFVKVTGQFIHEYQQAIAGSSQVKAAISQVELQATRFRSRANDAGTRIHIQEYGQQQGASLRQLVEGTQNTMARGNAVRQSATRTLDRYAAVATR